MPHIPEFPVDPGGFRDLHAPFLNERRTSGCVQCGVQEIRGIWPGFGQMWELTDLSKPAVYPSVRDKSQGNNPGVSYTGNKPLCVPDSLPFLPFY